MTTTWGIYARISQDRTGDDEQHAPAIDRQLEDCRKIVRKEGTLVGEYIDNGISAYSGKPRPAYKKLIADIQNSSINAVAVYHLDRLHRSPKELEHFVEVAQKHNVKVTTANGVVGLDTDDGLFQARILTAVSAKESGDKSRRVKRANLQAAREGRVRFSNSTTKRPFGWNLDNKTLNKKEAALLRAASKRLMQGDSLSAITREWNAKGVKTSLGNEWSYTALKSSLTAPRMAALVQYSHHGDKRPMLDRILRNDDGSPVRGQWESILDEETYYRLLTVLTDPSRRTNHVQKQGRRYLLTGGLAICGACGKDIAARPREHGDGTSHRSYGCSDRRGCGIRQSAEVLEDYIRDSVIDRVCSADFSRILAESSETDNARDLVSELESVQATLNELDDSYFDGDIPKDRYERQKERQEERSARIRAKLAKTQRSQVMSGVPRTKKRLRDEWDLHGLAWQRALVSSVVKEVVVKPIGRGSNEFNPERIKIVWR